MGPATREPAESGFVASPVDPILVAAASCETPRPRTCGMISASIGVMDQTTPVEGVIAMIALRLDGIVSYSTIPLVITQARLP